MLVELQNKVRTSFIPAVERQLVAAKVVSDKILSIAIPIFMGFGNFLSAIPPWLFGRSKEPRPIANTVEFIHAKITLRLIDHIQQNLIPPIKKQLLRVQALPGQILSVALAKLKEFGKLLLAIPDWFFGYSTQLRKEKDQFAKEKAIFTGQQRLFAIQKGQLAKEKESFEYEKEQFSEEQDRLVKEQAVFRDTEHLFLQEKISLENIIKQLMKKAKILDKTTRRLRKSISINEKLLKVKDNKTKEAIPEETREKNTEESNELRITKKALKKAKKNLQAKQVLLKEMQEKNSKQSEELKANRLDLIRIQDVVRIQERKLKQIQDELKRKETALKVSEESLAAEKAEFAKFIAKH